MSEHIPTSAAIDSSALRSAWRRPRRTRLLAVGLVAGALFVPATAGAAVAAGHHHPASTTIAAVAELVPVPTRPSFTTTA